MSESLGTAVLELTTDDKLLIRGLKSAEQKTKASSSKMHGALSGIAKGLAFAGVATGIGLLTGAVRMGTDELFEMQKASAQTEAGIKSTGGAAKVTKTEIERLAQSLMKKSGVDDQLIQQGENLLLTFTNVRNEVGKGNDVFNRATKAALDLSVKGFGDMSSTSKMLGKALQDPVKGMTAMSRAGVTFTAGQKETIKALVENGKNLEAQKMILAEVEKQVGGAADAFGKTAPGQIGVFKEELAGVGADLVSNVIPSLLSLIDTTRSAASAIAPFGHEIAAVAIALAAAKTATVSFGVAQAAYMAITGSMIMGVRSLSDAMLVLKLSMLSNPVGWLALGIGALAAGIYVLTQRTDESAGAMKRADAATRGLGSALDSLAGGNLAAKESALQVRVAETQRAAAHKATQAALDKYGKGSQQYKDALLNEQQASQQVERAVLNHKSAVKQQNDNLEAAKKKYKESAKTVQSLYEQHRVAKKELDDYKDNFERYGETTGNVARKNDRLKAKVAQLEKKIGDAKAQMDNAKASLNGMGDAADGTKGSVKALVDTIDRLKDKKVTLTYNIQKNNLGGYPNLGPPAGRASGGWVFGEGTTTSDSIPIMASNKEFVVNAKAAQQNAGLLEAINSGKVEGYATGGRVGKKKRKKRHKLTAAEKQERLMARMGMARLPFESRAAALGVKAAADGDNISVLRAQAQNSMAEYNRLKKFFNKNKKAMSAESRIQVQQAMASALSESRGYTQQIAAIQQEASDKVEAAEADAAQKKKDALADAKEAADEAYKAILDVSDAMKSAADFRGSLNDLAMARAEMTESTLDDVAALESQKTSLEQLVAQLEPSLADMRLTEADRAAIAERMASALREQKKIADQIKDIQGGTTTPGVGAPTNPVTVVQNYTSEPDQFVASRAALFAFRSAGFAA